MDWIVFGDDWGSHPSTTQHLVRNLPATDRIIWLDSIGMRSPRLSLTDARRVISKARSMLAGTPSVKTAADSNTLSNHPQNFVRIKPKVIPFHLNALFRSFNRYSLRRDILRAMQQLGIEQATLLTASPVAVLYADAIPHTKLAYLRLDDYAHLPGTDPELVTLTEQRIYQQADVIFATARQLLPSGNTRAHYLPQGVDWQHFAKTPTNSSGQRVLGFFGLIAEWIDFDLIEQVAAKAGDWTLEFIGPVRYMPERLKKIPNIHWKPAVPFDALPQAIAHWTCAWIPFEVSELTRAVNPLKAREYLAAGLPSMCTPLPEVIALQETSKVMISDSADETVHWMNECFKQDTPEHRLAVRDSVANESWNQRCDDMRRILLAS